MKTKRVEPEAEQILSAVYKAQSNSPQRALVNTTLMRKDLGIGTQRYYEIVRGLIRLGLLLDVTDEIIFGKPLSSVGFLSLRLTPRGQTYCEHHKLT